MQVQLGSFVEMLSGELDASANERTFLMEVTELFEDSRVCAHPAFDGTTCLNQVCRDFRALCRPSHKCMT